MKRHFKDIHARETCVVIGNGPSLRKDDLEALAKKYPTLGSNKIYRLPFTPTYYSIIDEEMLAACLPLPEDFKPKAMFLRAEACVENNNYLYPIVFNGFSMDIDSFVVLGGTVTYALLQIAYYMGFQRSLLVGVDQYYPSSGQLRGGSKFIAGAEDPDHFECEDGKPYFTEGVTFNAPEVKGTTGSYKIAKELFDNKGREIVNITRQTHLDVFPKDKLENWI